MNAAGIAILSLLIGLIFFAPQRWALLGMMAGVLYLPLGQVIDLFGLHLYAIRVLALVGFLRVVLFKEFTPSMLNTMDKVLILAYGYRTLVFLLNANGSAVTGIGLLVDVLLSYFAFRGLVGSFDNITWLLRGLVILLIPYVSILLVEMIKLTNPFALFLNGGATEAVMRNGRPRCVGSFAHPTILGTFGASLIPLYFGLAKDVNYRMWAISGIILCLAMVLISNSGGPLGCVAFGIVGCLFWFIRTKMHLFRRTMAATLLLLILFMKAPIWYLPAKLSIITGGDGWHRSYLMDVAFENFGEWWLAGMSVLETKDWFPYVVVTGGADIINYYLDFGLAAGVVSIGLFIWFLTVAFGQLGRAMSSIHSSKQNEDGVNEYMLWALGVVLGVHIFNWFGLVYFDQFYIVLFMQLAAISTLSGAYETVATAAYPKNPVVKVSNTYQFCRYRKSKI